MELYINQRIVIAIAVVLCALAVFLLYKFIRWVFIQADKAENPFKYKTKEEIHEISYLLVKKSGFGGKKFYLVTPIEENVDIESKISLDQFRYYKEQGIEVRGSLAKRQNTKQRIIK